MYVNGKIACKYIYGYFSRVPELKIKTASLRLFTRKDAK
jgi:hypothetical protein